MELEREIEKWLGREMRSFGCLWYKWVSPGARGVPDRIAILPDGRVLFVELKTENGKLSPLQVQQIERLRTWQQHVAVIRGMDDARDLAARLEKKYGRPGGRRRGGDRK